MVGAMGWHGGWLMLVNIEMALCLPTLSQTITDGLEVRKMIQRKEGKGLGRANGMAWWMVDARRY